jgi:hypothetical protein
LARIRDEAQHDLPCVVGALDPHVAELNKPPEAWRPFATEPTPQPHRRGKRIPGPPPRKAVCIGREAPISVRDPGRWYNGQQAPPTGRGTP